MVHHFCSEKGHVYAKCMKARQLGKKASPLVSGTAQNEKGYAAGELVTPAPVNVASRGERGFESHCQEDMGRK